MPIAEDMLMSDDLHPIDVVESIAAHHAWEFDRLTEDQITMEVTGQWRSYSLTLAWHERDETLRLICTFEMGPPTDRDAELLALVNRINDECWAGAFTWWAEQRIMCWRYGLVLGQGQGASLDQVERMIRAAVTTAERFYPAFQLVSWGGQPAGDAMKIAMAEAWGRA